MDLVAAFPPPPVYFCDLSADEWENESPPPPPLETQNAPIDSFGVPIQRITAADLCSLNTADFVQSLVAFKTKIFDEYLTLLDRMSEGRADLSIIDGLCATIHEQFVAVHNIVNKQRLQEAMLNLLHELEMRTQKKQAFMHEIDSFRHELAAIVDPIATALKPDDELPTECVTFHQCIMQQFNKELLKMQ